MEVTQEQAKAIRRKQADNLLSAKQASEQMAVSQVTYRKITKSGKVTAKVYQKAMQWLAKDY